MGPSVKIIINHPPTAKKRHRMFVKGNAVHSYDPQTFEKELFKASLRNEILMLKYDENNKIDEKDFNLPYNGPLYVTLTFFMPIPETLSLSKKTALLWIPNHSSKPDLDNLAKFILDVGNDILWKDDRMITSLGLVKKYSFNPKIEIEVITMDKRLSEEDKKILGLFSPRKVESILELLKGINPKKYIENIEGVILVLKELANHNKEFSAIKKLLEKNHGN